MLRGPDRRLFLRGLGATLALPFLESAMPRAARADGLTPPKRILYYYVPNGFRMDRFIPTSTGAGAGWSLSPILAPLAPHKSDLLVLSGLDNKPGNRIAGDAGAGAHFQQTASFLTCTHVNREPFRCGRSIDQIAADAIGYVTPQRSLQLGMASGGSSGACGGASWPCAYLSFISWADETTPIAKQTDPVGLFHSMFGSDSVGVSEEDFERRRAQRRKVLDVVHEDARALQGRLGTVDRLKLEKYLTAVNETEDRVNAMTYGLSCDPGEAPASAGNYLDRISLMFDVLMLGFACDISRIATFMTHNGGASHSAPYDWVDYNGAPIPDTFHTVSHHGNNPEKLGKIEEINKWEVAVFASLLQRLKDREEVDGSRMLDNTIVFFSSEVSDGDSHSADNLPIVVAGNAQGAIETDRHLAYAAPDNTYADLHIALLEAFGVSLATFGDDGTQPLPGVLS